MKYPKINKKELDSINRQRFDSLYKMICESVKFDNNQNELGLTKSDIELLAWNSATRIISRPY